MRPVLAVFAAMSPLPTRDNALGPESGPLSLLFDVGVTDPGACGYVHTGLNAAILARKSANSLPTASGTRRQN